MGDTTMVYTGDYNMTPDRHLGAAQINHLQLDLLITESTYATTICDSKYAREREFLKVISGSQMCFWRREGPYSSICFRPCPVCPFKPSMINDPGPCVLFATPGMLTGGFSVEVFKHWAPSEKNLVTLPGYCLAGTLGHKLMSGKANTVDLDKDTRIEVRCQIHQLSFSPHTDAKGIMDLVGFLSPKHVILVHGEKPKMAQLKSKIESDLGIQTWFPANGETVIVPTSQFLKIHASKAFLKSQTNSSFQTLVDFPTKGETLVEGILMMDKTKKAKAVHKSEFLESLSLREKKIQFGFCCPMNKKNLENTKNTWLEVMFLKLKERVDFCHVAKESDHLRAGSLRVSPCLKEICCHRVAVPVDLEENVVYFCCSWSMEDEKLAWRVISIIRDLPNHVIDE